jgi:hypothetical protein
MDFGFFQNAMVLTSMVKLKEADLGANEHYLSSITLSETPDYRVYLPTSLTRLIGSNLSCNLPNLKEWVTATLFSESTQNAMSVQSLTILQEQVANLHSLALLTNVTKLFIKKYDPNVASLTHLKKFTFLRFPFRWEKNNSTAPFPQVVSLKGPLSRIALNSITELILLTKLVTFDLSPANTSCLTNLTQLKYLKFSVSRGDYHQTFDNNEVLIELKNCHLPVYSKVDDWFIFKQ